MWAMRAMIACVFIFVYTGTTQPITYVTTVNTSELRKKQMVGIRAHVGNACYDSVCIHICVYRHCVREPYGAAGAYTVT